MENHYGIIIVGGGPIGAATAWALAEKKTGKSILVLNDETKDSRTATYRFSGGSVRMWWLDEAMGEMTGKTAALIEKLTTDGVDLGAVKDRYVMVHRGIEVPSWNVAGAKLVDYYRAEALKGGVEIKDDVALESILMTDSLQTLKTSAGDFTAEKVIFALGSQTKKFLPDAPFVYQKRELLVFDVPVDENRAHFPHTVVPLAEGLVFGFIKSIDGTPRFVLGQEDLITFNDEWKEEDFLPVLVEKGLYNVMPFLKDAKLVKILWGFDSHIKKPEFYIPHQNILAVTCGSAIRSSAWIGEETARRILE